MSYTLRIYTNGDGDHYDGAFETLDALYASMFENHVHGELNWDVVKEGVTLTSGWAVYDNDTGLCINSINAAQVGHTITDPYQPFGPQVLGL